MSEYQKTKRIPVSLYVDLLRYHVLELDPSEELAYRCRAGLLEKHEADKRRLMHSQCNEEV